MDTQCKLITKLKFNFSKMGCISAKRRPSGAEAIKSALLIQRWYRRYLARMEMRRMATWNIFTNLEYAGENDQAELYNFFNALLTHIPEARINLTPKASQISTLDYIEEGEHHSDKMYAGPHLRFPLHKKDVKELIDLFRKRKADRLLAKYVGGILTEAANHLKRLPNLNQASTAISKQVTVIGDLHGKLDDLLVIFYKNGLPSTENPYVFNGDFVDRGKRGLEVFLLLLASFLAFPGAVHLNRGNHEDSVMNARYGFIREVQTKYRRNSEKLLGLIDEVYRWLPLGTIVNNRVLIVHGGISDTTDLDMIKSIDRGKYVSILRPPVERTSIDEGIDKTEWKQIFDIMWSDPQNSNGCIPNALRGAGTYFGPDISKGFLDKYNLKYLVRSHECKLDGYERMHDGRVITIFSASNYYAIGSNKGAFLRLSSQLDTHFVQYVSAASKTKNMTFRQRVSMIEGSALRELGGRLREAREELETEFKRLDPKETGVITVSQWCDVMERVTQMGLPWRLMREKLAPVEDPSSNNANYITTLELLDTDVIVEEAESTISVSDALYKNRSSLEAIFHILDKDQSGQITLDEFGEAIDLLRKYMPSAGSREELLNMCKMMDINKDGFVDLNEFLEAFRLSDQTRHKSQSAATQASISKPRTSPAVTEIADKLSARHGEPEVDIDPRDHIS